MEANLLDKKSMLSKSILKSVRNLTREDKI